MIVYLIRHGETDLNMQRRLQGQSDIPLNQNGRRLAELTGQALREIHFDHIFSSPLGRALETARIIAGNQKNTIIADKRIQEICFGEYEGLCYGAQSYSIPDPDFLYFFEAPECYAAPPGGESFADILARTGDFWRELAGNPKMEHKTILVSTHGCALKAILANIRQTPLKDFWGKGVHRNCAVTIVEGKNGNVEIVEEGKIFYG